MHTSTHTHDNRCYSCNLKGLCENMIQDKREELGGKKPKSEKEEYVCVFRSTGETETKGGCERRSDVTSAPHIRDQKKVVCFNKVSAPETWRHLI